MPIKCQLGSTPFLQGYCYLSEGPEAQEDKINGKQEFNMLLSSFPSTLLEDKSVTKAVKKHQKSPSSPEIVL